MAESGSPIATGVVLAGGASRRMGRDKAALVLDGEPLLARVVNRLREAIDQVMVIGPPDRARIVPDVSVFPDLEPGLGPLGGIYSALRHATTPRIFVAATDMPFLCPALVRHLIDLSRDHPIVVPRTDRGTEPLHAVYSQECVPAILASLRAGDLAVASVFARVPARVVERHEWMQYDPDGLSMLNVNTPEEWATARALAARGGGAQRYSS